MIPLGVLGSARAAAPPTMMGDNFNRADSALALGVSSGGQEWITHAGGIWGISSNGARPVSGPGDHMATMDIGMASGYRLETTIIHTGGYPGLIFRFADVGNYYHIEPEPGRLWLFRWVGGARTALQSVDFTWIANQRIAAKITEEGAQTRIEIMVDDVSKLVFYDGHATRPAGESVGLRWYSSSALARFDNLLVEAL